MVLKNLWTTFAKGDAIMFYQVKVLDKDGSVKKVISSKSLSNKFWKRNKQGQEFTGSLSVEDGEFEYGGNFAAPQSAVKVDASFE